MAILVKIPRARRPRKEVVDEWRKTGTVEQWGGWEFHPITFRCPHGVWLTETPGDIYDGSPEGNLIGFEAPYCEVCQAVWQLHLRGVDPAELPKRAAWMFSRDFRPSSGMSVTPVKLESARVWPEQFWLGKGCPGDRDLRFRKEEGPGGYVVGMGGFAKRGGLGHAPDDEVDDIRQSFNTEASSGPGFCGLHDAEDASSEAGDEPKLTQWTARLLSPHQVEFGKTIGAEHWQPVPLPFRLDVPNCAQQGFLTEAQTFSDQRSTIWEDENRITGAARASDPRGQHEPRWQKEKQRVEGDRAPAASDAATFLTDEEKALDMRAWWTSDRWFFEIPASPQKKADLYRIPKFYPPLDAADVSLACVRRPQEARHEYPISFRRQDWNPDWRTERKMDDLAADLKMHVRGSAVDEGERPLIDVKRMCQTAQERFQSAHDALIRQLSGKGKIGPS
jgi:hypothetical protein